CRAESAPAGARWPPHGGSWPCSRAPFREGGQLVANLPELREMHLVDEPAEHFDRGSLGADDGISDDARNDAIVADSPGLRPFVELHQRLRELGEVLVPTPLDVDVDQGETGALTLLLERLTQERQDPAQLCEPGRVEAGAVTQHLADLLVLPRRHVLEHVELGGDELKAEHRSPQESDRSGEVTVADGGRRCLRIVPAELEPELRRLVR